MKCLICEHESPNFRGHGIHIKKAHNMSTKDYYDKYLKTDKEDICPICGNTNNFININVGYCRVCSVSCGQKHPDTRKRIETTNIVKYGKSTPSTTSMALSKSHNKDAMDKKRQTMINKYGYANSFCTIETQHKVQNTMLERYGSKNPMVCNKQVFAKYNGTRSSWESMLKIALENANVNFRYEYNKDLRYPYYCDFYLPDSDIFVEINGYWMHNTHWFDENSIEDLNALKEWKKKAKTSTRMQSAINIWTKIDIEKRNCAKSNKLNYVVLWTIEDIQNWIDSNFKIKHDY